MSALSDKENEEALMQPPLKKWGLWEQIAGMKTTWSDWPDTISVKSVHALIHAIRGQQHWLILENMANTSASQIHQTNNNIIPPEAESKWATQRGEHSKRPSSKKESGDRSRDTGRWGIDKSRKVWWSSRVRQEEGQTLSITRWQRYASKVVWRYNPARRHPWRMPN